MLVLSDNATEVIRALGERDDLPDDVGLRIAGPSDGTDGLTVSPAELPADGDQVVEAAGARVFLEPTAAVMLDDKVLDAQVDNQGVVQFVLALQ